MECKKFGFAILGEISYNHICDLLKREGDLFNNKNAITLMRVEKGKKVDWAQIMSNSLCNELDWRYKYVKENKGDKKDTCQSTLILAKVFKYLFIH